MICATISSWLAAAPKQLPAASAAMPVFHSSRAFSLLPASDVPALHVSNCGQRLSPSAYTDLPEPEPSTPSRLPAKSAHAISHSSTAPALPPTHALTPFCSRYTTCCQTFWYAAPLVSSSRRDVLSQPAKSPLPCSAARAKLSAKAVVFQYDAYAEKTDCAVVADGSAVDSVWIESLVEASTATYASTAAPQFCALDCVFMAASCASMAAYGLTLWLTSSPASL